MSTINTLFDLLLLPDIHSAGDAFDGVAVLTEDAGSEVAEFSEFADRDDGY